MYKLNTTGSQNEIFSFTYRTSPHTILTSGGHNLSPNGMLFYKSISICVINWRNNCVGEINGFALSKIQFYNLTLDLTVDNPFQIFKTGLQGILVEVNF